MEDYTTLMPYLKGHPLLFTYRQTAAVAAGVYDFGADMTANPFTPDRPIRHNVLYAINTMSFAMDITQEDYWSAVDPTLGGTLPEFSMYIRGEGGAPELREPLVLSKYFERMPYFKPIIGKELLTDAYPGSSASPVAQTFSQNGLLGLVNGTLVQVAALLGKASITAIVSFTAHEITDEKIIAVMQGRSRNHATSKVME